METINSSRKPRSFSLGLYLLIVFGVSWPFQIASAIWATDLFSRWFLNSVSMVMVGVGTFIAGRYIFRDGFKNAGWRWGKPQHYLAVFGLVFVLWIFPTLIRMIVGTLKTDDLDMTKIVWLFLLPLATLIPGFGEEFGWRGYLLPHLAHRLSVRKAVTLQAIIWWAWHLPVLIGAGVQTGVATAVETNIPVVLSVAVILAFIVTIGAIPAVMNGIIFAYIWVRSESLAVATVYHAAYDGVRDSLGMFAGLPSMLQLWANALVMILGIAFLWKGNWKKLEEKSGYTSKQPNPT